MANPSLLFWLASAIGSVPAKSVVHLFYGSSGPAGYDVPSHALDTLLFMQPIINQGIVRFMWRDASSNTYFDFFNGTVFSSKVQASSTVAGRSSNVGGIDVVFDGLGRLWVLKSSTIEVWDVSTGSTITTFSLPANVSTTAISYGFNAFADSLGTHYIVLIINTAPNTLPALANVWNASTLSFVGQGTFPTVGGNNITASPPLFDGVNKVYVSGLQQGPSPFEMQKTVFTITNPAGISTSSPGNELVSTADMNGIIDRSTGIIYKGGGQHGDLSNDIEKISGTLDRTSNITAGSLPFDGYWFNQGGQVDPNNGTFLSPAPPSGGGTNFLFRRRTTSYAVIDDTNPPEQWITGSTSNSTITKWNNNGLWAYITSTFFATTQPHIWITS